MKKFFTLVAMATMALGANAQTESAFIDAVALLGEGASSTAVEVAAGTELCSSANVTMKAAYGCTYKIVAMTGESDPFKTVTINGTAFSDLAKGIQGQSNPANAKNATTQQPADNAIFRFDVKQDGYLYVFSKLSPSKQYYAFEGEKTATTNSSQIAYTIAMGNQSNSFGEGTDKTYQVSLPADAEGYADYTQDATYPFTTIGTYFLCDLAGMRSADNANYGTNTFTDPEKKVNSLGVIGFPVYADAGTYYVFAVGSKVTCDGFCFVPGATSFGDVQISGSTAGINGITADAVAAPAVKKVVENGQVVIVKGGKKFNVAGAQLK